MLPKRKGGLRMYAAGFDLHECFEAVRLSSYASLGDQRSRASLTITILVARKNRQELPQTPKASVGGQGLGRNGT